MKQRVSSVQDTRQLAAGDPRHKPLRPASLSNLPQAEGKPSFLRRIRSLFRRVRGRVSSGDGSPSGHSADLGSRASPRATLPSDTHQFWEGYGSVASRASPRMPQLPDTRHFWEGPSNVTSRASPRMPELPDMRQFWELQSNTMSRASPRMPLLPDAQQQLWEGYDEPLGDRTSPQRAAGAGYPVHPSGGSRTAWGPREPSQSRLPRASKDGKDVLARESGASSLLSASRRHSPRADPWDPPRLQSCPPAGSASGTRRRPTSRPWRSASAGSPPAAWACLHSRPPRGPAGT